MNADNQNNDERNSLFLTEALELATAKPVYDVNGKIAGLQQGE